MTFLGCKDVMLKDLHFDFRLGRHFVRNSLPSSGYNNERRLNKIGLPELLCRSLFFLSKTRRLKGPWDL